jgi:hypothetical protein
MGFALPVKLILCMTFHAKVNGNICFHLPCLLFQFVKTPLSLAYGSYRQNIFLFTTILKVFLSILLDFLHIIILLVSSESFISSFVKFLKTFNIHHKTKCELHV